jgi:hypothetical protein
LSQRLTRAGSQFPREPVGFGIFNAQGHNPDYIQRNGF